MITLGVIADTHIPDRTRRLNTAALSVFRQAEVDAILHAGDISTSRVLRQLEEIAPVYAVRGNRDWVALRCLPPVVRLVFDGVSMGMAHGQGSLWNYLTDRVLYYLRGLRLEVFERRLLETFPEADVIIYGHTHRPVNHKLAGKLFFNPGSAAFPEESDTPSVGLLRIHGKGEVEGEIVLLS